MHPLLRSGKPDYSRTVPCKCVQQEQDDERLARLKKYSNLGSLTRFTFENLIPEGRTSSPQAQERFSQAFKAAKEFAAKPEGWLVYSGPSGSGKTHLAAAIVNECIEKGFPALYLTTPDLLDRLRASINTDAETSYNEFFEQVKNAPLLALDDLGVQSGTNWAKEKLDQLLTYRFNSTLPTVIVTAVPLDQLDDRLRTRLTDTRLCRVFVMEEASATSIYAWQPEFKLQKNMTFESWDRRLNLNKEQQENLDEAYRLAVEFARNPKVWLILMGVTGCGKTHLASAIVNYQYQSKKPALFVVVPEFLDHLRSTFNPESKVSYDQFFENVKTTPLLVLDDFGEHSASPWVREKLYQLINYRYNAQLPTIITTRYSLEEINEDIDDAVSSRLVDREFSYTFGILAPDFRTNPAERHQRQKSNSPHPKSPRNR